MRKVDVISDVPDGKRTRRGTYTATIAVGGSFVDYYGDYLLPESAIVTRAIESRLRSLVGVSVALEEDEQADGAKEEGK